jgi:hypothetical protein
MPSDGFLIYYGVRYLVSDEGEIAQLREAAHPAIEAALQVGLQYWWGYTPQGNCFLLVGTQIGNLGQEGASHRQLEDSQLFAIIQTTKARLLKAGVNDMPALHAQFETSRAVDEGDS